MKIKFDFVTNSSSSSFIVAWPKIIETIHDVMDYISNPDKVDVVYKDAIQYATKRTAIKIRKTKKVVELIMRLLSEGYWGQAGSYSPDVYQKAARREHVTETEIVQNPQWSSIIWDEEKKKKAIAGEVKAIEFIRQTKGHYLYVFQYGDEDGEFMSEMEHGGTFKNVPHIQVSHH